jgi:hypothetical protein
LKAHSSTSTGIAVLNVVLNYVLSRRWRDYDDFSVRLTERILAKNVRTEKELTELIFKISGQFFKLNNVSRRDFAQGFPSSRVIERMNSSIAFTDKQIVEVHKTVQLRKPNFERVYVEEIDSFSKVKTVSREEAQALIPVDVSEEFVKKAICKILSVSPPKDWGGERSDLYADVRYLGKLIPAAFMLKANGTPGKLTVRKCGKNGDQILRLVEEPARLFIVQHVDSIDSNVVRLMEIAVGSIAKDTRKLFYSVWDGIETARLLLAYGFMDGLNE